MCINPEKNMDQIESSPHPRLQSHVQRASISAARRSEVPKAASASSSTATGPGGDEKPPKRSWLGSLDFSGRPLAVFLFGKRIHQHRPRWQPNSTTHCVAAPCTSTAPRRPQAPFPRTPNSGNKKSLIPRAWSSPALAGG